jgi:hypothetical protein
VLAKGVVSVTQQLMSTVVVFLVVVVRGGGGVGSVVSLTLAAVFVGCLVHSAVAVVCDCRSAVCYCYLPQCRYTP